jgi:proteasome lid subunit RPN8/RPN11
MFDFNDEWENTQEELKIVDRCGHKPTEPINIYLNRIVKNKIYLLMKRFPNTEWLAYLQGNKETKEVVDLIIPEQNVTSTNVVVINKPINSNIIGVIHSHHGMGAFFSGTDDAYINMNNDISIVVAHNGSKAVIRWTTPCGSKCLVDGNVIIETENLFDEVEFLKMVDENVNQSQYTIDKNDVDDDTYEEDDDNTDDIEDTTDTGNESIDELIDEAKKIIDKYDCLRPRKPENNKKYVKGLSLNNFKESFKENLDELKDELNKAGIH